MSFSCCIEKKDEIKYGVVERAGMSLLLCLDI